MTLTHQSRNTLYYGDNLDILQRYIPDESADLIYLDPPFKSNSDYNVLFAEHSGGGAAAQIKAFEDTWTWDTIAARAYEHIVESGGAVSTTLQAFRQILGESDMMAYLVMMAPRLVELRRVLKQDGTLYLHCDEVASHWLKVRDGENRLHFPSTSDGALRLKMYLDESKGIRLQNLWEDIPALSSKAKERLGYPTQKPEALLDRIISTSSSPGHMVLDPFCGCGTTVAVAQRLGRQWIGIDITHLAVGLIKYRLQNQYGTAITTTYTVIGEPVSLPDARQLASEDKYQFQFWSLGLVGARPAEEKKGADKGIDGNIYFHDDPRGKSKRIIISVKGGENINVGMVRDLVGTVSREKADLGVMITLIEPTAPMRKEAASAGFYTSPMGGKHQKIQVLTVEELLNGVKIDYPTASQRVDITLRKAARILIPAPKPNSLFDVVSEDDLVLAEEDEVV